MQVGNVCLALPATSFNKLVSENDDWLPAKIMDLKNGCPDAAVRFGKAARMYEINRWHFCLEMIN